MGMWADHAATRRDLVRRSYDLYRGAERRLSPSLGSPSRASRVGRFYQRVEISEPYLAMTFDDGPDPDNTPRLLDILAERGIRATFYLIGELAARHPDVVRRTAAEGHELGNHTWSHRFLTTQTAHRITEELGRTSDAIQDATGVPPGTLRPPYGAVTPALTRWIDHEFGYPIIHWSVTAQDWDEPSPEVITERLLSRVFSGAIILNHDPIDPTVAAMPETLDRLVASGYHFATVGELMARGDPVQGPGSG